MVGSIRDVERRLNDGLDRTPEEKEKCVVWLTEYMAANQMSLKELDDLCYNDSVWVFEQIFGRAETDMVVIKAESTEQAVELVLEEYKKSDVCIGELFASIELHGLSVEDVVKMYAELYEQIEGDEICRVDEDGMRYSIGT